MIIYAKKHRKAQNEHIRLSLSVAGDMFFHFCSFIYMGSVEMTLKNLIALSVKQANVGNVEIIEWAVQRIADLEQENEELKIIRDMLIKAQVTK